MPSSPAEDELVGAIKTVRDAHPEHGIAKLWAQLKVDNPEWTVSEKRFRKALATAGGTASGAGATAPAEKKSGKGKAKGKGKADGAELVARTGLDSTLDIDNIAPKVKAKMFGGTRGKGLVAKSTIEAGEVLWQEEPWIACPDPALAPHLVSKRFCAHCLGEFSKPNPPLSLECLTCTNAHFCNRLCLSRARPSASHHDLLCPGVNPLAGQLQSLIAGREWRSLDVVARIIAKWRYERAWGTQDAADEITRRVWEGIARVNMATRESEKADWATRADFTTRQWKLAHESIVTALNPEPFTLAAPRSTRGARKQRPLTDEEVSRWFSYESFLELLGMVNINLEDSGGMYALHAHLNHSCDPNIQVRNLPRGFVGPTQLPAPLPARNPPGVRGTHKLTMLARNTITPGTELTISYVNLELPRDVRRQALRDGYGFWCECVRCEKERVETEAAAQPAVTATADVVDDVTAKMDQLAVDQDETAVEDML